MSTESRIRKHVCALPSEQIFTTRDMLGYGSRNAVDQALCNLVADEFIVRLTRGVFARIEIGNPLPSMTQIALAKIKGFGRKIVTPSWKTAQECGLPVEPGAGNIYYIEGGASSSFTVQGIRIHLRSVASRKALLGETTTRQAIKALWHLQREYCTMTEVQMVLKNCLTKEQRSQITCQTRWMPSWLGDLVYFNSNGKYTENICTSSTSKVERTRLCYGDLAHSNFFDSLESNGDEEFDPRELDDDGLHPS